jgi:hypothetical protein
VNHRQLELVRTSYERIHRVRPLFADLFDRRLALVAPAIDRLLPADRHERERAVVSTMEWVIRGLDRLDVLLPQMAALARALRRRGVEPADYDAVGEVLVWSVEQVLAGSSGDVAAWCDTYDLLASVMKRAAADPVDPRAERTPPRSYRLPPGPEHSPERDTLPMV